MNNFRIVNVHLIPATIDTGRIAYNNSTYKRDYRWYVHDPRHKEIFQDEEYKWQFFNLIVCGFREVEPGDFIKIHDRIFYCKSKPQINPNHDPYITAIDINAKHYSEIEKIEDTTFYVIEKATGDNICNYDLMHVMYNDYKKLLVNEIDIAKTVVHAYNTHNHLAMEFSISVTPDDKITDDSKLYSISKNFYRGQIKDILANKTIDSKEDIINKLKVLLTIPIEEQYKH